MNPKMSAVGSNITWAIPLNPPSIAIVASVVTGIRDRDDLFYLHNDVRRELTEAQAIIHLVRHIGDRETEPSQTKLAAIIPDLEKREIRHKFYLDTAEDIQRLLDDMNRYIARLPLDDQESLCAKIKELMELDFTP